MFDNDRKRAGQALVPLALALLGLTAVAGLGVDTVLALLVRSQLQSAVDGAVMAASRAALADRQTVATQIFNANFPVGYMMTSSRSAGPLSISGNRHTMTATAAVPTFFMKVFGRNSLTVNAGSTATLIPAADPVEMIVIDEDSLDNSTPGVVTISNAPINCGNGNSARCVNDDIANPYVRTPLFQRGRNILPHAGLTLPTGQTGDEGLFRFSNPDPQRSQQNGATFTMTQLVTSTGAASNENNLDKIDDVIPMRTPEIQAMNGKRFCALVFDSDVSVDTSSHYAVLKGATMGLTAFTVTSVGSSSGSTLPNITVTLLSVAEVNATCGEAKAFGDLGSSGGTGSGAVTVYRE